MESVLAALVTGALTLAGVLVSNSKSRAVLEAKVDALAGKVEKHNQLIERTYGLEREVAVLKKEMESIERSEGR